MNIKDAVENLKDVGISNAKRMSEAKAVVLKSIQDTFEIGRRVLVGDIHYTVLSVDGENIIVKGKGRSKRMLHFSKLETLSDVSEET